MILQESAASVDSLYWSQNYNWTVCTGPKITQGQCVLDKYTMYAMSEEEEKMSILIKNNNRTVCTFSTTTTQKNNSTVCTCLFNNNNKRVYREKIGVGINWCR